jgi:ribosomal protein L37E
MALIRCPECARRLIDTASTCAYCGYPIQTYLQKKIQQQEARQSVAVSLKYLAIMFGGFVLLGVLNAQSTRLGLYAAGLLGLFAFVAIVRPFFPTWLGGRYVGITLLFVTALGASASWELDRIQRKDADAKNEARLPELRMSDPVSYLAELKASGDFRWEAEFKILDPKGYEMFVAERREVETVKILDELKMRTDVNNTLGLYVRLATLEPTNQAYRGKRNSVAKRIAEVSQEKQQEAGEPLALGGPLADLHDRFNVAAQRAMFDIRMPPGKCTETASYHFCTYMLTGNVAAMVKTISDKRTVRDFSLMAGNDTKPLYLMQAMGVVMMVYSPQASAAERDTVLKTILKDLNGEFSPKRETTLHGVRWTLTFNEFTGLWISIGR